MLTEQQQTKYNTYRRGGATPEEALALVKKNNPAKPNKGIDNVLFGKGGFVSSVGEGIKDATVGVVQDFKDIKGNYGTAEAVARLPLTLLAGAGEGVGKVIGSGVETADDILLQGMLGKTLSPEVEKFVQSQTGQSIINGLTYVDQKTHGIAGDVLDAANLLGVTGLVKSAPAQSFKQSVINTTKNTTKSLLGKVDDVVKTSAKKIKSKSLLDDFAGEFDNLDDAMKSPKSGITPETTGVKSQFAPERISVPDKVFLIDV